MKAEWETKKMGALMQQGPIAWRDQLPDTERNTAGEMSFKFRSRKSDSVLSNDKKPMDQS